MTAPADEPRANAVPQRKLFYMHVAKTGGTSFNAALERLFPPGRAQVHIENRVHGDAADLAALRDAAFISGHVSYPLFLRHFDGGGHFRLATLRRPLPHLWSHLNWVRHLSDPGREAFLAGHPAWVQATSLKIRDTDFHDAASVTRLVASLTPQEKALFDNCQTRYFAAAAEAHAPDRRAWLDLALRHMESFDLVGLTEQLEDTYALLCLDLGLDIPPAGFPRLNRASSGSSHEDLPAEVLRCLAPLVQQDFELYVAAQKRYSARAAAVREGGALPPRLQLARAGELLTGTCPDLAEGTAWLKLVFDDSTAVYVKAGPRPGAPWGFGLALAAPLRHARRVAVYAFGSARPLVALALPGP